MKNRFLSFLKKNYITVILSLIYPLVTLTNLGFLGNTVIGYDDLGPTDLFDVYIVFAVPLLHFIYGCIMCRTVKNALIANIITTIVYLICFSVASFPEYELIQVVFFSLFPIVFSLLGTGITALIKLIYKNIKSIYKNIKRKE